MLDTSPQNPFGPGNAVIWLLAVVAGLVLPAILIPVVALTENTVLVEELAKSIVVIFVIYKLPSGYAKLLAALVFGLLFGLSESMLYLNNIFQAGDLSVFGQRLLYTVPMHALTVIVMTILSMPSKWLMPIGIALAIGIHTEFNVYIVSIF